MRTYGYDFYFKIGKYLLTFPITPGELTIKSGSNNDVVNLINGGDINILKSPSLTEIEFEARFPMRKYPYSRKVEDFQTYFDTLKKVKFEKTPFDFVVSRTDGRGISTWATNYKVALEDLEMKESANEGDDVLINFRLKQYEPYGVITLKTKTTKTTKTSKTTEKKKTVVKTTKPRTTKKTNTNKNYTVKKGDCLWNIAKKFYGKGSYWKRIYNTNKTIIEKTAKKYGRKSSSNGHWIYPGTKLIIPGISGGK